MEEIKCLICGYITDSKRSLSSHLQRCHNFSTRKYTIDFLCGGIVPSCKKCFGEVRYVSFEFKKYCSDCAKLIASDLGKEGGRGNKKELDFLIVEGDKKYCRICKQYLSIDNFYKDDKARFQVGNTCKSCSCDYQKLYREENKSLISSRKKEKYEENKTK